MSKRRKKLGALDRYEELLLELEEAKENKDLDLIQDIELEIEELIEKDKYEDA
jgi:hypothetical protein